jgi:hypothetical protein
VPKARDFIKGHPNIIFVSTGMGMSSDRVAVSVNKNFSDYTEYVREMKTEWAEFMTLTDTFLIALNSGNILRPISLKYLADCLEKEKLNQKSKA